MLLVDLLTEPSSVESDADWENEQFGPVGVFGVCLHARGLSLREAVAVGGSALTVLTERSGTGRMHSRETSVTQE